MTTIVKHTLRNLFFAASVVTAVLPAVAQTDDAGSSSSSVVRRGKADRASRDKHPGVTDRMQQFYESSDVGDADRSWMRVIYRQIDLTKDKNTPLYFPEEPVDGQENLFRVIMRLLADDRIAAYEYLDGRELFTDNYRIKVRDMLDRFHVYYTEAKGSNEKHPRFTIEEADVPCNEVLSYYIVERWEFDRRSNRMQTRIDAICPVLHRAGDFGGDAVKYPMFWVKYDDLRPFIATQNIFLSDDNNLPSCTYDDYFQLSLYDGEIYKTRNLRNRSMAQLYPDPEDLKRAQDSIQRSLDEFGKKLWVPSLDELAARREAAEMAAARAEEAAGDSVAAAEPPARKTAVRTSRGAKRGGKSTGTKPARVKKPKAPKKSSGSSGAARSVRNRRR
ncbi:MAG: gliding motility protein GldN [Paramuribaculum sp.]|nr:gliding motility protein GldN [Paramuribaculum sp.]